MKALLRNIYFRIFPRNSDYIKRHLLDCNSVLDLGCGKNSLLQHVSVPNSLGVDVDKHYLEESKRKRTHSQYILADIKRIEFAENSFDAVLMIDVLEHLSPTDGQQLIHKAQRWAGTKVILSTPNGFLHQVSYDNNPWQIHRSGWTPTQLEELRFKVHGINGWKALRGHRGRPKHEPEILWRIASDITQTLTYFVPTQAFQLLCVWRKP